MMCLKLYQRFTSPSSLSEEDSEEGLEEEEENMSSPIQEPCKSGLLQITGQSKLIERNSFYSFVCVSFKTYPPLASNSSYLNLKLLTFHKLKTSCNVVFVQFTLARV